MSINIDLLKRNTTKCSMCSAIILNIDYISHVVRYHRFEPKFQVQCKYDGCGVTFHKWKSFRQHLWRRHHNIQMDVEQVNSTNQLNSDINDEDDGRDDNDGEFLLSLCH